MGGAPSRIPTIEKAEVTGGTTVRTLRQADAAMNCAFVAPEERKELIPPR
jgi:hypothetical protein